MQPINLTIERIFFFQMLYSANDQFLVKLEAPSFRFLFKKKISLKRLILHERKQKNKTCNQLRVDKLSPKNIKYF